MGLLVEVTSLIFEAVLYKFMQCPAGVHISSIDSEPLQKEMGEVKSRFHAQGGSNHVN